MIHRSRWLLLSDGARPTEDIYFLASVVPLLRSIGVDAGRLDVRGWRWRLARWVLIRQPAANLVLCRTLPEVTLSWLEDYREWFGRIVYLVDDDLAAAGADVALPEAYRERMDVSASQQARIMALADEVVVCSSVLAEQLRAEHGNVSLMTPPLISLLPGLAHFSDRPASQAPWQIGFYGTRVHLADLEHIAPALRAIQQKRSDSELELMLGEYAPQELAELPRTRCPAPLGWKKFRQYQSSQRVHIELAPLLDTPFNRGKSFIKFLDIAAMGGVGVYSDRPPYTEIVEHGVNGLLASDDPDDWQHCLNWLLDNPDETRRMAEEAAKTAEEHRCRELPEWAK